MWCLTTGSFNRLALGDTRLIECSYGALVWVDFGLLPASQSAATDQQQIVGKRLWAQPAESGIVDTDFFFADVFQAYLADEGIRRFRGECTSPRPGLTALERTGGAR